VTDSPLRPTDIDRLDALHKRAGHISYPMAGDSFTENVANAYPALAAEIRSLRACREEVRRLETYGAHMMDEHNARLSEITRLTKERDDVIATIKPWARLKYEDVGPYSREGDHAQLNLVVVALDALLARIQGGDQK
jgi:hypothetical protein